MAGGREWARLALAFAFLFGSLPLANRLIAGSWRSPGAIELACLCLLLAAYLHVMSRTHTTAPEPAAMLAEALDLAAAGHVQQAIARLTETIHASPWCWQAFEYRGALHLAQNNPAGALEDLTRAIELAPAESHLYALRAQAHRSLGEDAAAQADEDEARSLDPSLL
jgi:tetratricopeptide (TPR) repeat protein